MSNVEKTAIGLLPTNWEVRRIKDVCDTTSGGTPSRSKAAYYDLGTIPWIKTGELRHKYIFETEEKITEVALQQSSAKLVPKNSVLMAMYGATIGKTSINKIEATTNQACCAMISKGKLEPEFLYYVLSSNKDKIVALSAGGAQPNISQQIIREIEIPFPPQEEQQKIVSILTSVDEAIEKTEAIIEQTEKVKKGLMQQLFTKGIGHTKFKKTEIGEVPEEWEVLKVQDIALKVTDGEHKTPNRTTFGELLLSARNVKNNMLDLSNVDYVSQEELEKITKRCNPEEGDILISCSGTVGRVCVVPKGIKFGLVRSVALVKSDKGTANSNFLMYVLQSHKLQEQMRMNQSQLAQANLFLRDINALKIPFPSLKEQEKIAGIIGSLDLKLTAETRKIEKLSKIKKGLMQSLLTGKVRVKADETEVTQV
ncbi:hypothetical protein CN527_10240 [Bacillus cereus]|nr:hypothetical protein CN527_10240 [Bacillus cereus]PGN92686.1 hypothetical protein CN976_23165 [Bacillus cereus]